MATEIAKAYVQIIPSTKGIKEKLREAMGGESLTVGTEAGETMADGVCGGMGEGLKKLGGIAAGAFTALKITDFGMDVVKTTASFEDAMLKAQSLSGATEDEYKSLTDAAIQYGSTTAWTSKDVADAMGYMALAGFDTNEILASTSGMLSLASASGEELATVTDILTDSMTGFGDGAEDAGRYADVLATVQAKTNTTVGMLGEAFKYVSPLAGAYGYEMEDVSAALGQMANAGVKGSMAGTALSSIITRLGTDTDGCREMIAGLGVEFYNTDGTARAIGDVLMDLTDATADMTTEEKSLIAKTVAGQEAQKGLLAVMNQGSDSYEALRDQLYDCSGAAGDMAENMESGVGGAMRGMESAMEGFKISLGQKFQEPVGNLIRMASEKLVELTPVIMDVVDRAIGAFDSVKNTMSEMFASAQGTWNEVGQPIMDTVNETLDFFSAHAEEIFDGVQTVFNVLWEGTQSAWENIGQPVFNAVQDVIGITAEWFQSHLDDILAIWNGVVGGITDTWEVHLKPAFGAIGEVLENYVLPAFEGVFQGGILPAVETAFGGIIDIWEYTVKPIFDGICDFISGVFSGNWEKAWEGIKSVFVGIFNVIPTTIEKILNSVIDVINGLTSGVNGVASKVGIVNLIPQIPHMEIPHMETGGVLEKGQVGLLEGNGAEAVVPLENNHKWIKKVAADMTAVGGRRVEEKLDRMANLLQGLYDKDQNIVLDDGTLVGRMAPKMNRTLGRMEGYGGRRN